VAKPNILIRSKHAKAAELFNRNQLSEADALYAQLCQLTPADAEPWVMRGLIHRKLGQWSAAEGFCRRALVLDKRSADAQRVLGQALQCQGRLDEAAASYRKALGLQPADAQAHYLLANALREQGVLPDAVRHYREAIRRQPDFVEALCNLGAALTVQNETQEATQVLNRAVVLNPRAPQVLCNLGNLLQRDGKLAEALDKYQRALALNPDSLDAATSAAALLEKTGELDSARVLVERTLPRAPNHPQLLLAAAKLARRDKHFDTAIGFLETLLAQPPDPEAVGEAHMLLGQMYDRKGDAGRAYAHLAEGNRLVAGSILNNVGNSRRYLERVERLRRYLTPSLAGAAQATSMAELSPVFLLGFPRSGTTLMEQILDSHPALQALEEKATVSAMVRAFEAMVQEGDDNALANLTEAQIGQLRTVYFDEVNRQIVRKPGTRLVDKMPLNTVNVHLIWRVFPDARFILAIRHPCDVCLSCFMQNFMINDAMASFFTLESTAEVYGQVMQTWQLAAASLPLVYHRVRYEDLVADFEGETRALLDFLGVGWDDRVRGHTEHAMQRGTINTPSYHQVTQPIYQHAKYRWKRYAEQFESVMPTLKPFIDYFDYAE
jgi:tetratricopeptide (TPR) repeat protein